MFLREPGRVFSTDFRKISQTGALTLPTEVEALGALPPQSEPHPEAPRREPPLVKRGRRPALTFGGGVGGDDLSVWQS